MDFRLTEAQLALQQLAHRFSEREIRPRARELDREADPSQMVLPELVHRAAQLGLQTLAIPGRDGGADADTLTEVVVLEELAWGDLGFATIMQHCWREGGLLAEPTTPDQHPRFPPELLEAGPGGTAKTAARTLGVGRACFEEALAWAKTRVQDGKPIVEHQAIAVRLAEMATRVDACRALIWRAAWSADCQKPPDARLGLLAKVFTTEAMMNVAVHALEILGGDGLLNNRSLERRFRDVASMLHTSDGNPVLRTRVGRLIDQEWGMTTVG